MPLLDLVAGERTAQRAKHHRHVAAGSRADQAADSQPPEATDDCTDTAVVVALHLHLGDLLDNTLADLHRPGLLPERWAGSERENHEPAPDE